MWTWTPCWWEGQRTITRLLWADRKAMVTRINTLYNRGELKSISEPCRRRNDSRRLDQSKKQKPGPWISGGEKKYSYSLQNGFVISSSIVLKFWLVRMMCYYCAVMQSTAEQKYRLVCSSSFTMYSPVKYKVLFARLSNKVQTKYDKKWRTVKFAVNHSRACRLAYLPLTQKGVINMAY